MTDPIDEEPGHVPGATGDSDEYDDLDPLESAALGILSELSMIRYQMEVYNQAMLGREVPSPQQDSGTRDPPDLWCNPCGIGIENEAAAEQHAREEHKAPPGAYPDIVVPFEEREV